MPWVRGTCELSPVCQEICTLLLNMRLAHLVLAKRLNETLTLSTPMILLPLHNSGQVWLFIYYLLLKFLQQQRPPVYFKYNFKLIVKFKKKQKLIFLLMFC